MDTIKNYLDNMFSTLPGTEEINRARAELEAMMEDKYNELKADGASENEAVGAVISEFGNIEEVLEGMGYCTSSEESNPKEETGQTGNARYAEEENNTRREKRRRKRERENREIYVNEKADTFISLYWPTVTCIYLILSFLTWGWGITWIIWPIAAVIFAVLKRLLRVA